MQSAGDGRGAAAAMAAIHSTAATLIQPSIIKANETEPDERRTERGGGQGGREGGRERGRCRERKREKEEEKSKRQRREAEGSVGNYGRGRDGKSMAEG